MKILSILLAAATMLPAPAIAQDADRRVERVSLAGVRFDDGASMRALRLRIRQAATRVCSGERGNAAMMTTMATMNRCRNGAIADAEAQLGRTGRLARYASTQASVR